jgi:LysM repeat protein
MDPEVLLQLEEQLRQMNELLAQQNAMMASQMGAMKNNTAGFNSAFRGFNNGLTANGQTLTKYAEAQKKVVEEANASAEKWRNGAQMVEKGLNTFGTALNSTAGIVGSFAGALLSSEKGFSKFGGTVDAAAGAAQGLASSIPGIGVALGAIVGTVGKIVSKVVGDALKLTDAIVNLRDETVKTAGALPTTSEGMLQLANNAKYFGENIQVLGKITQGVGTGLASLGMTAGHGATKFMEMANVSDEVREQFGKMGISQEELTQMQATYIKQQQSSGMALSLHTKSVDQLRKESLKYAQDLNALSAITGKQADQLRAEQETAAAVLQEKIAQRQDMIEIDRLRKDGRHAEAAELEAKAQATAKFRDTMSNLVGPEQTAQIMRVIRTGVYDGVSGPMANLGLDFEQIRSNLAQGKDGMAEAAGFADQLRGAQDKMLTNFGQAALFLDDESFKSVGGNLESLSRLSDTYGKTNEEMLAAARKSQEERKKGSPMDDAIEKARAFERNLQQRYQDFLINGIKKAAALLNATDLNKLANDAMVLAAKAAKIALVGLAGATGLLLALKVKEKFAAWEARKAQAEFTRALKDSTAAMREMSRASRSASAADRQEAAGSNRARSADVQEANASNRARAADTAEARASTAAARADTAEARASTASARADTAEARASTAAARADLAEARASNAAAKADMREAASGGGGGRGGGRGGGIGGILARGAMAIGFDQVLGQFGVGDMTNVDEAQLQSQDDQNWERASTWEKIQSSIPRGIEHLGKLFMLDNISNQARMDRIKSETEYLNKTYGTVASPKSPTQDTGVDAELEKQLAVLGSISMPGNGQDMMQMMSPEQLAALGISAGTQYTAKKGDTLKQIAEQHGISTDELLKANPNLKNKDWKEGYKLNIPTGTTGSGKYTIQQGDTLSALAAQYGTTVEDLMKANPNITDPNKIYTGNELTIPGQSGGGAAMNEQMLEQVTAMYGPEMAQKMMEQIQSGMPINPEMMSMLQGGNFDASMANLGGAAMMMSPEMLGQMGMMKQSQLAFAKPESEEMIEDAKYASEKEYQMRMGMLEDQQASVNDVVRSNTGLSNSVDGVSKSLRLLRDLMNELNKVLGGTDADGNPAGGGGMNMGGMGGGMQFGGDTDKVLATIRQMESGNNYTAQNPTSSASGAYQFIDSTWQSLTKKAGIGTEFKSAKDAPAAIQDQIAQMYLQEILGKAGGDLSKVPTAWFTGNVQGKSSVVSPAQVQAYVQKWMGIYSGMPGGSPAGMAGQYGGTIGLFQQLNPALAAALGGAMGGGMGGGMGMDQNIVSIGRYLQDQHGLRISEHPAFGGVAPVHKGRGHYEGRAIDVNVGRGNKEADDPVLGAKFDMLAEQLRKAGLTVIWRSAGHYDHMHVETPSSRKMPYAEKGGVFKGPDSGYLAMLHGKEAVVPLDNKFTRTQSSESYTVNGKAVGKKEYDAFMKANPQLQQLQDKVQSMMSAVQSSKADPTRLMQAATSLMDTNLTGIKDEIIDKNKKIQDSITQMVATETNKAIKAVNEANLPMQTMANQMSGQMRKVMEAHTQSMNELAYKLSEMIDAMNTSNDTTKKILKKANA